MRHGIDWRVLRIIYRCPISNNSVVVDDYQQKTNRINHDLERFFGNFMRKKIEENSRKKISKCPDRENVRQKMSGKRCPLKNTFRSLEISLSV